MNSQTESAFIQLALEHGFVSSDQIRECESAAAEMAKEGDPMTLRELLFQRGYLKPEHVVTIEKSLQAKVGKKPEKRNAQFGEYQLLAHLGRGGMAHVYLARREGQTDFVAVKILHEELTRNSDAVERLLRETEALFKLDHPNIVRGMEFGNYEKQFYLAMEYVEGQTLKSFVKQKGPLPESEALGYLEQIASALDHAHQAGFIHRDIKPRNMLLRKDGVVKILDFGLSKSLVEDQDITQEGALLGTVLYAAPEQLRGSRQVDCRADIYSLGITLYYLLTGDVPFHGSTSTATAAMHFEQPLPDPQGKRPDLSPAVCTLLKRMTRKSPDSRYQTPAELLADIRLLRAAGRVSEKEPGDPTAETILGGARTGRWLWWSVAAGLAVAVAVMILAYKAAVSLNIPEKGTVTISEPLPAPQGEGTTAPDSGEPTSVEWPSFESPRPAQTTPSETASVSPGLTEGPEASGPQETPQAPTEASVPPPEEPPAQAGAKPETEPGQVPEEPPPPEAAEQPVAGAAPQEKVVAPVEPAKPPEPESPPRPPEAKPAPPPDEPSRVLAEAKAKAEAGKWDECAQAIRALLDKHRENSLSPNLRKEVLELLVEYECKTAGPDRLFAGKVRSLERGVADVSYDFTDAVQFRDWISLGGGWQIGPKGLGRARLSGRDVLWWRHPHGSSFKLTFEASGFSHLHSVVGGNGLSLEEGNAYVCGLGHEVGTTAAILTGNMKSLVRRSCPVIPNRFYSVEVSGGNRMLTFRIDNSNTLREDVRRDWDDAQSGNGPLLGLYGFSEADTVFRNIRVRAQLPVKWLELEKARVRAEARSKRGLLSRNFALKTDEKKTYGLVSASESLRLRPPFTLELWFTLPPKAGLRPGTLVAFGLQGDSSQLAIRPTLSELRVAFRLGFVENISSVEAGAGWHHLALLFDGTDAQLYFDGKSVREKVPVPKLQEKVVPLILGHGASGSFKGEIDEVRLSNVLRYDAVFVPQRDLKPDKNALLLLKFNEGEGNQAFDSSEFGNNAHLVGAAFSPVEEEAQKP